MRLAVLLCGVLAGVIGLGFGWWGDTAVLLKLTGLPLGFYISSVLAVHIVSVACIAGGVLVLANPQAGGALMLLSAIGWLVLVALLGGGLGTSMAMLIGVSAGGGAMAFLPGVGRPLLRFDRGDDVPRQLERPRQREREREQERPQPLSYARPAEWSTPLYDALEDHSQPYQPFETFQPSVTDDDRRDFGRDFGRGHQIKGGQLQPIKYKVQQQQRRAPPRRRSTAGIFALLVLVLGVPTVLAIDYLNHADHSAVVTTAATEAPEKTDVATTSGAAPAKTDAAKAGAVKTDAGKTDVAKTQVADVSPKASPTVPDRLTPTKGLPLQTAALADATAQGTGDAAEEAVAPDALPMPAPVAVSSFDTPFDYCAGNESVDDPDMSRIKSGLPQELIDGVREVTKIPDGEVRWRCMTYAVWLCVQAPGGVACGKVPTTAQRQAYCTAHPDKQNIPAAAGSWSCNGTKPVVPGGQDRTTDGRGYDRLAWLSLSRAPVVPAEMNGAVGGAG